jgi:hypothetical protein
MKNFHRCDSTKPSLLSSLPRASGNMITMNRVLGKRNGLSYTASAVLALGPMPSGCKKSAEQTAANNPPDPPTQAVPVDIRQPAGRPALRPYPRRPLEWSRQLSCLSRFHCNPVTYTVPAGTPTMV